MVFSLLSAILEYHISSNKCRAPNKRRTFGYQHKNKRLPLISAAPLNMAFVKIVTISF